ncbi:MAG: Ig-like domain repeat protein, partial [Rhodospirillales bacterium]|nr:Ig-like domain repeat protein [Acetobacter sp.]
MSASYGGDSNYNSATSNSITETVGKANVPSDVLTTSNANPTFGSSVTFTDTLGAVNGTYPSGTVTFYNGTISLGTGQVNASGVAALTLNTLPGGSNTIKATYGGDSTFNTALSNAVGETVTPASGYSDVLTTSNNAPAYGSSITLTDTLPAISGVYPTGSVDFKKGTTTIGTGVLDANGVATLTLSNLPVGSYALTAMYAGDGNFAAATSNAVTENVAKASGYGNVLTTSNSNPSFGTSVTLTDTLAPVNGTYASGTVTFYNGTASIGTGVLSATGVATLTLSSLPVGADTITAGYPGDVTFSGSTSNAVTETVGKAAVPGNVLTSSNANPAFGGSVTLTDTLGPLGGSYPSGIVTFYSGTTVIGTSSLNASGVATLTTSSLPVGTDAVSASYGGDGTFTTSTSNTITETVAKATGYSDVLTSSNATPSFGTSVTLTDTIAPVNGVYATGVVTFYNGSTSLGTGAISATGVATLTTAALPAGTDSITAAYNGDATFGSATSNAVTETVAKASGYGDVLTTSNASPSFGSSVTLTDTLAAVNGVYPTGTITFFNGTTVIGTGAISSAGVATLITSSLPAGSDPITAGYGGDTSFAAATSNSLTENVAKASGYGDVLSASNTSPSYGASITLTDTLAAVNGVYPTGSVTFYNGSAAIGTGALSAGVATLTTATLPVGADSITAAYPGDANFAGATSNAVTVDVAKANVPSDVLTSSNPSPGFGASVTLTDTLGALSGTYPTGTVTFFSGSTPLGTGSVSASGIATLTTSALPTGTDSVTAVYGGNGTFSSATSNTVTETVSKAQGTNTLATSNASPVFGSSVILTATLSTAGSTPPTGTVTFYNGTNAIGTGSLSASGVASLTLNTLPVGSDAVSATYGGDGNY